MGIGSYVKEKQPFVYKTFSYALNASRLAHSYLLLGEPGTPLKETAIYMAKSILCDHGDPLADESCITCQRIDKGEYPDFVCFDGESTSIKKDDVATLVSSFQQTALERKGIRVYVIHLVENMTTEAVNALLKFLEEPPAHAYAILTTQNESKVLPTIVSRCQSIRMILYPREKVVQEAIDLGVDVFDAELWSHFYNDATLLQESIAQEDAELIKRLFGTSIDAFSNDEGYARFALEKDVVPYLNKKQTMRLYFDTLAIAFEDIVRLQSNSPVHLKSIQEDLQIMSNRFPQASQYLSSILALRGEIELNINAGLLLPHLTFLLYRKKAV